MFSFAVFSSGVDGKLISAQNMTPTATASKNGLSPITMRRRLRSSSDGPSMPKVGTAGTLLPCFSLPPPPLPFLCGLSDWTRRSSCFKGVLSANLTPKYPDLVDPKISRRGHAPLPHNIKFSTIILTSPQVIVYCRVQGIIS